MGVAVAVDDLADRPGWLEKILVLGICAVMLVAIHAADQRGRERNADRAGAVTAERAKRTAPPAAPAERHQGAPIMVPSVVGPGVVLHRTQGPSAPDTASVIPEPAAAAPVRRGVPAVAAAAPARTPSGVDPILLVLMGAAGISMCGAGLRLLSRRSA